MDQKEPQKPGVAVGINVGRDILIILAGISTIWTVFSTGGLTAVYQWLNSIPGAPFLSLLGLGAVSAWSIVKKYLDKQTIQRQSVALDVATATAPQHIVEAVQAAVQGQSPVVLPEEVTPIRKANS